MTPNGLLRAWIALIEEISPPVYDRVSGDDQPITFEQWEEFNRRWQCMYAMNKRKEVTK